MKIELIDDWKTVLKKAWSVRFALLGAVAAAAEAGWQYYMTGQKPVIAIIGALVSLSSGFARIVAQPRMTDDSST